MDKNALKKYVEENPRLIGMNETSYPGLYVLKYKKRVFYDNLWNQFTEECRGTIVDKDFNVISRPFTKIYNYGIESKAPKLKEDTIVTAYRKINGFMVAVTLYQDDILVSTTGSTNSPYVAMAKEIIQAERYLKVCKEYPGFTFMFECVHENDPHIIPELPGMYLLGWRENTWDSQVNIDSMMLGHLAKKFGTHDVGSSTISIRGLQNIVKAVKHEGFVFYTEDGVSAKIKSPYYLVNKWMARNPHTDKLMTDAFQKQIDEEYYPILNHIRLNIDSYTTMTEQERLEFARQFFLNNC